MESWRRPAPKRNFHDMIIVFMIELLPVWKKRFHMMVDMYTINLRMGAHVVYILSTLVYNPMHA